MNSLLPRKYAMKPGLGVFAVLWKVPPKIRILFAKKVTTSEFVSVAVDILVLLRLDGWVGLLDGLGMLAGDKEGKDSPKFRHAFKFAHRASKRGREWDG
jgi:hypothetical protein